jgi:hypothetical protein
MTALLALAAELLGPMLEAVDDPEATELRSLRFALVARDPDLSTKLTDPELTALDLADVPLGVWAWWLDWRRSRSSRPPAAGFLNALFHASNDPLIRLRVVQSETWHPNWVRAYREGIRVATGLDAVPGGFLGDGLRRVAGRPPEETRQDEIHRAVEQQYPALDPAELALHLLQLGDRWSLTVLDALLDTSFEGQGQLAERYRPLLRAALAEEE